MASKDMEVFGYCDKLYMIDETNNTQVRKVIAVLPNHVWVYILTYTTDNGKRITLPYECKSLKEAISYLAKIVERSENVISYEIFGDTVVKKEAKSGEE